MRYNQNQNLSWTAICRISCHNCAVCAPRGR